MSHVSRWNVWSCGSAVLLCATLSFSMAVAQAPAKARGRLPAYYKDIVDARQKEQIYSIQAEFNGKIDALKEQIEKLADDRDAAVESVLTPAQKGKLKIAKEAAAAKRKKPVAARVADGGKDAE
jgi:hypothetical protein